MVSGIGGDCTHDLSVIIPLRLSPPFASSWSGLCLHHIPSDLGALPLVSTHARWISPSAGSALPRHFSQRFHRIRNDPTRSFLPCRSQECCHPFKHSALLLSYDPFCQVRADVNDNNLIIANLNFKSSMNIQ